MAVVNTLIGHIKGPKGDTGETGATGARGAAGADATVTVGSTTTVPYGQTARVTNVGTPGAAVFNFTIPQGKPGEQTTKLDALTLDALTEPSASFPVPAVGDNGSTLFGKISKFCGDIKGAITGLSVSGRTVTYRKADGTTGTITTQDTAYGLASTSADGLLRQLTGDTGQWMRGDGTWQTAQNNLTTTAAGYVLDARMGKTLSDAVAVRNSGYVDATTSGVTVPNTGAWTNIMFVKPTSGTGVYLVNVHLNAKTENDEFTGVRIYIESTAAAYGGVTLNNARTYHDTRIIPLTAADVTGRIFVQVSSITTCTFESSWGKNILSIIRLY